MRVNIGIRRHKLHNNHFVIYKSNAQATACTGLILSNQLLKTTAKMAVPKSQSASPTSQLPLASHAKDLRQSARFLDIQSRYASYLEPSANVIVDFAHISYSPDRKFLAGVGTICKELKGTPPNRLAILEIATGEVTTFGEVGASDAHPRWAPDGKVVSFLSTIEQTAQLHLLDLGTKEVKKVTSLNGTIEGQAWSPDGKRILLTVAGTGADSSGCDGGFSLVKDNKDEGDKTWMPSIETAVSEDSWRTSWVYDLSSGEATQASPEGLNVWQAVWTSNTTLVGLCSDLPAEEYWYGAQLREIDVEKRTSRPVHANADSIENLRASPSGAKVAFATSVASDRQIVKGDMHIVDVASGKWFAADTDGVNVACLQWVSDDDIVAVGSRNTEEVIVHYNLSSGKAVELWKSDEFCVGPYYMPYIAAVKDEEIRVAFTRVGWFSPPTLLEVSSSVREIRTFSSPEWQKKIAALGKAENVAWKAPDGLEIYGFFIAPPTPGPHPTIMVIHGGPVWQFRPWYLGAHGNIVLEQALLAEGFAIFKPNPRGSAGRGQEFARHVYGDMGGKDTHDYLSGLDHLVATGRADGDRLGVTGGSYGGFMSSWLITQTPRFKAAVPVAPITEWVTAVYTSHTGRFCSDFLNDDPHNKDGRFYTRSPLQYVRNVTTPTLTVVGARDHCTPPDQGLMFHRALVANGQVSAFANYPDEGHGVRQMPALFDYIGRAVEWFKHYV